jgi:hypothetical protein
MYLSHGVYFKGHKNVIFDRERHQIISDFYEYFCSVNRLNNVSQNEGETY